MLIGYVFYVDNVHIDNTRSRDSLGASGDTDFASLAVRVGDRSYPVQTAAMGDLKKGDHNPGLMIGPVPIEDSGIPVVFNYLVVNAGHSDPSQIQQALSDAADKLAIDLAESGSLWGLIGAGAIEGLNKIVVPLLTANCDGWVAGDQISMTGAQLRVKTEETAGFQETRSYPGLPSNKGCGDNSQYSVLFSVYRPHWTGWYEIPKDGFSDAKPATCLFKGEIYLFIKGTDSRVYVNRSKDSVAWVGWTEVPGGMKTDTGLGVTASDSRLWLVAKGFDHTINLTQFDDTGWSSWSEVAGGGRTGAAIAIQYCIGSGFLSDHLYIFCKGVGSDQQIYMNSFKTSAAPHPLPAPPPSGSHLMHTVPVPPSVVREFQDFDAHKFGTWQQVPGGGLTDSAPAAYVGLRSLVLLVKGVGRPSSFWLEGDATTGGWGTGWTEVQFVQPGSEGDGSFVVGMASPSGATFNGQELVFALAADSRVYGQQRSGADDAHRFPISALSTFVDLMSSPSVLVEGGMLRVFCVGKDQRIYMNSWDGKR